MRTAVLLILMVPSLSLAGELVLEQDEYGYTVGRQVGDLYIETWKPKTIYYPPARTGERKRPLPYTTRSRIYIGDRCDCRKDH